MSKPPRKLKRYDPRKSPDWGKAPSGQYLGAIQSPEILCEIGDIASSFVHLESRMANVLAVLLGIEDVTLCGYVLRAIKSPRGRVDLLRDLLQLAPNNKDLSDEFDFAIDEFWEINRRRNEVVHAEWWSHEDGSAYAAIADKHGAGVLDSREVKIEELRELSARLNKHVSFVTRLTLDHFRDRRQTNIVDPEQFRPNY